MSQTSRNEYGAWNAIVLGAGISGLVSASILIRQGCRSILVLDSYDRVGGNHIDCSIPPYTFDIGPIIFQDDSPLLVHFPELLPLYHPITYSVGRITPDHQVNAYPFDIRAEILHAGPKVWARVLSSLLFWRVRGRHIANTQDYMRYWIGDFLVQRSGLHHYVERFSGLAPEQIEREFAEKRMYWIADAASVRKSIARVLGKRESWDGSQSFVRPREGFVTLYTAVRERLESEGVQFALSDSPTAVVKVAGGFLVHTAMGEARTARLISTIPLSQTLSLCGLPEARPLPTIELISLFFSFAGERGFSHTILYNFSANGRWKRLTMFSDFYGLEKGRAYFSVEVNAWKADREDKGDIVQAARDEFISDIRSKGLLVGDLVFEGAHRLTNAYPSYPVGASNAAARGISALRALGVESFGRQGGFDYLPTARHVTLAAETALAGPATSQLP
jgi:protoporphyrinogen oxidase